MKPPRSCLDRSFKYISAAKTDLRATFARIRREQEAILSEQKQKVSPLKEKRK